MAQAFVAVADSLRTVVRLPHPSGCRAVPTRSRCAPTSPGGRCRRTSYVLACGPSIATSARRRSCSSPRRSLGRRRVRHEVLIGPFDRVAPAHDECRRLEAHVPDGHLVDASRGRPRRHGRGQAQDQHPCQEQRSARCSHRRSRVEACSCPACSRCATKAGRTLTRSAFSSLFFALGIKTLSSASSTFWW
jgi:hypothetical protein